LKSRRTYRVKIGKRRQDLLRLLELPVEVIRDGEIDPVPTFVGTESKESQSVREVFGVFPEVQAERGVVAEDLEGVLQE
jgi:hypothetical protein